MKKIVLLASAVLFFAASNVNAQQTSPPEGAPIDGPAGPMKGPKGGPEMGKLEKITAYTGTVSSFEYNGDYVYDGFYLQTSSGKMLLKFAPHLGTKIQALGSKVTVNGVLHTNPDGVQEIRLMSATGNGQTVTDQRPAQPTTPPVENVVNGTAKISELQKNKRGETSGYVLDNGAILRIPPHSALQLSEMVKAGSTITYSGAEKITRDGEVQAKNYKVIRGQTVTVNGTQYLVK